MNKHIKLSMLAVAAAALLILQACGTTSVSKGVNDEGQASEVIFPDIQKDAWLKEGTFVNLANLRHVAPGVSKDQLYDLLGRPHFNEGMGGVREWDYIFNFRTGEGKGYITCQYKVIFDKDYKAQTFHWSPAACADQLNDKPKVVAVAAPLLVPVPVPVPAPPKEVIRLSADALFAFGRSGLRDLQPGGQRELEALASTLRTPARLEQLEIVGHTDRIGREAINQPLSQARAQTVSDFLVSRGIPASKISARGLGASNPVVQCEPSAQAALIACLAPNRRVDITVYMQPER